MSHYHCEIIIPTIPFNSIPNAVSNILEPFSEEYQDEDGKWQSRSEGFYDWYVIGGRWAGDKLLQKFDEKKIGLFYEWCNEEGIMVSGVTCGKQSIPDPFQIKKVDAKWNEMFPREDGKQVPCPIFKHSNDAYAKGIGGVIDGDILPLSESLHATCYRVIFGGPSYNSGKWNGPLEAQFMLEKEYWNGTNFVKTNWDGKISTALDLVKEDLKRSDKVYRSIQTPQDDWLAITVDYHS